MSDNPRHGTKRKGLHNKNSSSPNSSSPNSSSPNSSSPNLSPQNTRPSGRLAALFNIAKGQHVVGHLRKGTEKKPLNGFVSGEYEWANYPNLPIFAVGYYTPKDLYSKVYEPFRIVNTDEWQDSAFQNDLIQFHTRHRGLHLLEPVQYTHKMFNHNIPRPDWQLVARSNFKPFSVNGPLHVMFGCTNSGQCMLSQPLVDRKPLGHFSPTGGRKIEDDNVYEIESGENRWVVNPPQTSAKWSCAPPHRARHSDICLYVFKGQDYLAAAAAAAAKRRKTYAAAAAPDAAAPGGGSRRSRKHKRRNYVKKQKKRTRKH